MKIKKGDLVKVISGKARGTVGKITEVDTKRERVFIENGPMAKRHLKAERSKKHPEGGIIEKPASIHASNVMLMCESSGRPFRIGFSLENGKKVRVSRGTENSGKQI